MLIDGEVDTCGNTVSDTDAFGSTFIAVPFDLGDVFLAACLGLATPVDLGFAGVAGLDLTAVFDAAVFGAAGFEATLATAFTLGAGFAGGLEVKAF